MVGSGRARVQLSADFDYNRVTQTSDRFDPDGRVVRSSQSREEQTGSDGREAQVTRRQRTAGRQQQQQPTQRPTKDTSKKTEEIVNYEISRVTKTEVTEAGRVNRISVAVLVDGIYGKNEKGEIDLRSRARRTTSTASRRWFAPPSASTASAATRSRSSTSASPRRRRTAGRRAEHLARKSPIHQG